LRRPCTPNAEKFNDCGGKEGIREWSGAGGCDPVIARAYKDGVLVQRLAAYKRVTVKENVTIVDLNAMAVAGG
jgi:hypothetical protein